MNKRLIASILAAASVAALSVTPAFAQVRHDSVTLNGVGSSADAPLYNVAFNGAHYTAATVVYNPAGSGGGQKSMASKCGQEGGVPGTWDFGSWDVVQNIPGDSFCDAADIIQWPVTAFGEAIITNLPSKIEKHLYLTGPILNNIFTGVDTKWGAKDIEKVNPAIKKDKTVAKEKITPVVRTDSSGTTFAFTSFLCATGSGFNHKYGTGAGGAICPSKTPAWTSVFLNGKGNPGLDATVSQNPGAIGYVESFYSSANGETPAFIKNKAGKFVQPNEAAIASDVKNGTKGSFNEVYPHFIISNAGGKASYPISTYSWAGAFSKNASENQDSSNCSAVKSLFLWFLGSKGGQKLASPNGYVPLSGHVQSFALAKINSLSC